LTPGQSFTLARAGLALVQAVRDASVLVDRRATTDEPQSATPCGMTSPNAKGNLDGLRTATSANPMTRAHVVAVTFGVLIALAAGALYLRSSSADTPPAPSQPVATPAPVATVERRDVTLWDEFSGRLEAVERVDVRSRVAGAVQSVHFAEGALVKRGDLLVTIDPAPYAAEAERAQAQAVAAQARLTYAKIERERAQRLWEERFVARSRVDERVNAEQEADANLRAAQAALQSTRLNLDYTRVLAPVAGRVGKLEITVGNLVAAGPGAPVLTTLVSVDPIYASFEADELVVARALKDLPRPRLAEIPVEIETVANGGTHARGRLQLIDNQVNTRSGTVRMRATFDNRDGALIPGQFVKVRMSRAKAEPALLVSERAVGTDQSKRFVIVVGPDDKAVWREVTLGGTANGQRIVTSGLEAGERIVVNGLQRVRPGSLIAPQPAEAAAAPPAAAS
jgi:multidrug efflux system membrane fusion protein